MIGFGKSKHEPTRREQHQMETLAQLQHAEEIATQAEACLLYATTFEEEAKKALAAARSAHRRLVL